MHFKQFPWISRSLVLRISLDQQAQSLHLTRCVSYSLLSWRGSCSPRTTATRDRAPPSLFLLSYSARQTSGSPVPWAEGLVPFCIWNLGEFCFGKPCPYGWDETFFSPNPQISLLDDLIFYFIKTNEELEDNYPLLSPHLLKYQPYILLACLLP